MTIRQAAVALFARFRRCSLTMLPAAFLLLLVASGSGFAQAPGQSGGEAHLILPDLSQGTFMGIGGRTLLMGGLLICVLGLVFGLITYMRLRDLPVHNSMREVSELIWETCKTYLFTQGKFLLILEIFIGVIILFYFGYFRTFRADQGHRDSAVQPDRNRRQLQRGLVRDPRQHFRQLAHGVCQPARQSVSVLRRFRCARA